ncbi:MAG: hypothetical protein KAH01_05765 [Caldisericia bacterium]|nr:hypothetical protein [Caldisericia bacterium]
MVVLSIFCAIFGVSQITKTYADTFDVVVEASINDTDYKLIEINNTTGDVNLYEFADTGEAILDGNNEQTTFIPGDVDFDDRMEYLSNIISFNSLEITSASEFALPIFSGDGYYGDTITQICYDGNSSTDYRVIQHNSFDAPFSVASTIGTLAYMEVGSTTYTGFKYTANDVLGTWDQIPVSGDNSASTSVKTYSDDVKRPVKFTIIGRTSSGKVVKVEDKGDGTGPHAYIWEDTNGDGEIDEDEWKEVKNDPDGDPPTHELDDLIEEIAEDIEDGLGSYSGSAYDADGNPIDLIVFFKKSDGSYVGFKMDYSSSGNSWGLDAKSNISHDCMVYLGYIPYGTDSNPDGAWSIGSRSGGSVPGTRYGFQNFARFDDDGNVDPYGTQQQYWYGGGSNPVPDPVSGKIVAFPKFPHGAWPPDPCPPI